MSKFDYKELGLKCGLEIHQQLDSETKLFCRCPNELQGTREPDFMITREMRPVLGEMGTYDEAMLTEYKKGMDIVYECYKDVICTYEMDETPPFKCNEEAIEIATTIALLLNSTIIKEMHVCRKNYLDGSVPCGFQKTMILGKDGYIELEKGKKVGIDIVCLEEDAARRTKKEKKTNYFRLDRLGIPLVEITTKPDINDPDECRECAERLGMLLWSTNVKRILGSIRQDINVSIQEGTRIEIKGVQKLDWIPNLINHEVSRQKSLIIIKKRLDELDRDKNNVAGEPTDLSKELADTKCKFIANGIKSGKKLYGINFKGLRGIFGTELMPDYRFGTEVSSKVQSISGLKGLIHSDENLPNYGFNKEDINSIKESLNSSDEDCFILILGSQKEIESAIEVILDRVEYAFEGVPPETRRALENGNTEFLRELHGGARLYPDTDTQPIINSEDKIREIEDKVPQYPWKIIESYSEKYNTEERNIRELIFNNKLSLFDELIEIYPEDPTLIFTTLLETTTALQRDGKEMEQIENDDFIKIFKLLEKKEISKEAIENILAYKADNPQLSIEDVKEDLDLESVDKEELRTILADIVNRNEELIKERQMGAMGPLMGDAMKELRGKIDGSVISNELQGIIKKKIKELKNK